jgi:excinuclease ABC subunit C
LTNEALEEKVKNFPDRPGVYLMKNERGKVIYVGKAKSLRKRVRSYFQKGDDGRVWSPFLAAHVADVDCVVTNTEKEAIILEDSAIKEHRPRYNIRLKDDKSFLRLKLTLQEEYPRLLVTRKVKRDGALYFGPYSSARAAREAFRVVNNHFMLRKCSNRSFKDRERPCIYHQMGKCMGPCSGTVDKETYAGLVRNVIAFLQGKHDELLETLHRRMQDASDRLDFEVAARHRDQIQAIEKTFERQKVVSHELNDRDVFGVWQEDGGLDVAVLIVRKGKLLGSEPYHFPGLKVPVAEALGSLLTQFYSGGRPLPKEVLLPLAPENADAFEQWLSETKGERVSVIVPERGDKRRLVEMAELNAHTVFEERRRATLAQTDTLEELQQTLLLRLRPERIEAFDMSNISGDLAVGSMVVFEDGHPKKSDYRKFKIRTVEGADDYAMMREVLTRHMRRVITEGPKPSLILVDGGKGQLNVALSVFEELGVIDQDAIGIAKEKMRFRQKSESVMKEADKVYIPHRKDPILLRSGSASLHLLQQIRDEAHRFAITYHKKLRAKRQRRSALDEITGIGPARRAALLKAFGSVSGVAGATEEQIAALSGISLALARSIKEALSVKGDTTT